MAGLRKFSCISTQVSPVNIFQVSPHNIFPLFTFITLDYWPGMSTITFVHSFVSSKPAKFLLLGTYCSCKAVADSYINIYLSTFPTNGVHKTPHICIISINYMLTTQKLCFSIYVSNNTLT